VNHEALYDPAAAALVVVGGVSFEQVLEHAKRTLSKWKPSRTAPPPAPREKAPVKALKLLVDRPGAVQTAIFVGLGFPRRGDEGFERRELLNQVLGGMFTSRLNQNLREKNAFTYGAYSHGYAAKHFGVWELSTSVKSEDTGPALREILAELEAIRGPQPITEEELERAKRELLGSYTAHLERSATVNSDLSGLFVDELGPDYLSRLGDTIGAIALEEVQREATLRIQPDRATIVLVGDRTKMAAAGQNPSRDAVPAPETLVD
jgi:zinc protease